jgi:hypothetical protein
MELKDPIFIVGSAHAGSTLLTRILGTHKNIYAIPTETSTFFNSNVDIQKDIAKFNAETVNMGCRRWLEKTPRHITQLKQIRKHVKRPLFIVLVRDGRDVSASLKQRNFINYLERWKIEMGVVDELESCPDAFCLKYEDLVTDTESVIKSCLAHVGEDYYSEVLKYRDKEFSWQTMDNYFGSGKRGAAAKCLSVTKPIKAETHEEVVKLRAWQIQQPLYTSSIGRWKNDLSVGELETLNRGITYWLIKFGYVKNSSWFSEHLENMKCGAV